LSEYKDNKEEKQALNCVEAKETQAKADADEQSQSEEIMSEQKPPQHLQQEQEEKPPSGETATVAKQETSTEVDSEVKAATDTEEEAAGEADLAVKTGAEEALVKEDANPRSTDFVADSVGGKDDVDVSLHCNEEVAAEPETLTEESDSNVDPERGLTDTPTPKQEEAESLSSAAVKIVSEHCPLESAGNKSDCCEALQKKDDAETAFEMVNESKTEEKENDAKDETVKPKEDERESIEKEEKEECNSADAKAVVVEAKSKGESEKGVTADENAVEKEVDEPTENKKSVSAAETVVEMEVDEPEENEEDNPSAITGEARVVTEVSTDAQKQEESMDWEAITSEVIPKEANIADTKTTQQKEEEKLREKMTTQPVAVADSADPCGVSPMADNTDDHPESSAVSSPPHATLSDIPPPVVSSDSTHAARSDQSDITECENDAEDGTVKIVAIDESCPPAKVDGNSDCANDISSFPCYRGDGVNGIRALTASGVGQSSVPPPPVIPIPETAKPLHISVVIDCGAKDVPVTIEAEKRISANLDGRKDFPQSRLGAPLSLNDDAASAEPILDLEKDEDDFVDHDGMCYNRIDAIKIDLYMECAEVHEGRGAEKLYAIYLERLGMYLVSSFDDSDEISSMRSLTNSGGIQQFFQVFLTTRTLRRLHNELILELMKQAMQPTISRKTFLEHAPEQWLNRGVEKREEAEAQYLKKEEVIEVDHVASPRAKRANAERRQDEDDILRLQKQFGTDSDTWNLWGGNSKALQSTKDNSSTSTSTSDNTSVSIRPQHNPWAIAEVHSKEIHIPSPRLAGALVTDKIIGMIPESSDNLVVTDNATWLMVIAAREYTLGLLKQVVKDCKARQRSELKAEAMKAAAAGKPLPPVAKPVASKATGKKGKGKGKGRTTTPKKKTTINPLDIALTVANNPYFGGGPHTFQPATRLAWESCICSTNNAARSLLPNNFDALRLDADRRMADAEIALRKQIDDEAKAQASSEQSVSNTTANRKPGRTKSTSTSATGTNPPSAPSASATANRGKEQRYSNGGPQHLQVELSSKPADDLSKPTCANPPKSSPATDSSSASPAPGSVAALRPAVGRGKGKNLAALRRKFSSKPPAPSDGASTSKSDDDTKTKDASTDESKDNNNADDVSSQASGSRPPSVTPLMHSKGKNAKNLAALRARSNKSSSPTPPPPSGATPDDNKRARPPDDGEETFTDVKRPRVEGI